MIKKIVYFSILHAFLGFTVGLTSCMSTKNVQSTVPDDDVYYSNARAKEIVLAQQVVPEEQPLDDYVTEEELYGDTYSNYGYSDYTSRINRFRGYHPSLSYYNSIYGYNYDPFFSPSFFPYSYFGSPGINLGIGIHSGFYSYNPWRFQGFNYGSNFWGPYSYFNPYNSFGFGFGGGNFNRGYYSGIQSSPAFTGPNYRARPTRAGDNTPMERGSVIGVPGSIVRDNSGNIIQSRGRAERYGAEPGTGSTPARTQTTTRPARVNQSPPARPSQPDRIYTAPRQDNGSGSRSSQPSNNSGGGSSGGARPSRGN